MGRLYLKCTNAGVPTRIVFDASHRGEQLEALDVPGGREAGTTVTFPIDASAVRILIESLPLTVVDKEIQDLLLSAADYKKKAQELWDAESLPTGLPYHDLLHPYQTVGAIWLATMRRSILADEPGLGKTIQALAACDILRGPRTPKGGFHKQRVLVVSLGDAVADQWARQIERWTGSKFVQAAIGQRAKKEVKLKEDARFTIVTHPMLRIKDGKAAYPILLEKEWDVVIIDEAHTMQGRSSQQSMGARKLKYDHLMMLTGTPVWNMPDSIWHLLHLIDPKRFSAYWTFVNQWCKVDMMQWGKKIRGPNKLLVPKLKQELKPLLLRRTEDALPVGALPEARFAEVRWTLSPQQREIYTRMKQEKALDVHGLEVKDYASVAAMLSDLRILCAAPRSLGLDFDTPKDEVIQSIVRKHLDGYHSIVIFAWHRKVVAHVVKMLQEAFPKQRIGQISGDVKDEERVTAIRRFKQGWDKVLVASISTTGTGTDLPNAHACIFVEESWVHNHNRQSWKRIHRVGMLHSPQIYRIIGDNCIEDLVHRTAKRKEVMSEDLLNLKQISLDFFDDPEL